MFSYYRQREAGTCLNFLFQQGETRNGMDEHEKKRNDRNNHNQDGKSRLNQYLDELSHDPEYGLQLFFQAHSGFFSSIELIALLADPDWLDDATKTIIQYLRRKHARRNLSKGELQGKGFNLLSCSAAVSPSG